MATVNNESPHTWYNRYGRYLGPYSIFRASSPFPIVDLPPKKFISFLNWYNWKELQGHSTLDMNRVNECGYLEWLFDNHTPDEYCFVYKTTMENEGHVTDPELSWSPYLSAILFCSEEKAVMFRLTCAEHLI
jgi:hypothetical protein